VDEVPEIEPDCPCRCCGYNLRGLRFDGNCPECGEEITRTLGLISTVREQAKEIEYRKARSVLVPVAKAAGVAVDAVHFFLDAWRMAFRRGLNPSTAADVCEVVRDHALAYFNDVEEARELLADWGIRRSEDLGRIVFALVDAGMLRAEPGESVRDFDGLFMLETLLSEDGSDRA
jgi:uncharacterized repeat protein (TIGR04138 family)